MKALIVTADQTQCVQKAQHFAKYTNSLLFLGRLNNLHNSMPSVLNLSYSMPHALTFSTRVPPLHTFPQLNYSVLVLYLNLYYSWLIVKNNLNKWRWLIESIFKRSSKLNSYFENYVGAQQWHLLVKYESAYTQLTELSGKVLSKVTNKYS